MPYFLEFALINFARKARRKEAAYKAVFTPPVRVGQSTQYTAFTVEVSRSRDMILIKANGLRLQRSGLVRALPLQHVLVNRAEHCRRRFDPHLGFAR
jgi:hypothetical protein